MRNKDVKTELVKSFFTEMRYSSIGGISLGGRDLCSIV